MTLEHSTLAHAAPDAIWARFSDVSHWPHAANAIARAAWAQGAPWQPGSVLELEITQPLPLTVEAHILACTPPTGAHWRGKQKGLSVEHRFRFDPQPDGMTRLHVAQEISGPASFFVSKTMQQSIFDHFVRWMNGLKTAAERDGR